jgi:hypothetical protein
MRLPVTVTPPKNTSKASATTVVKRARGEASDVFSDTHEGGGKRAERLAERDALRHRGHPHRRPCERPHMFVHGLYQAGRRQIGSDR